MSQASSLPKWKADSLAFRQAMRMAKAVSAAERQSKATGVPLHMLLPARGAGRGGSSKARGFSTGYDDFDGGMPAVDPSFIQCPHCGRHYNQKAGERHIPQVRLTKLDSLRFITFLSFSFHSRSVSPSSTSPLAFLEAVVSHPTPLSPPRRPRLRCLRTGAPPALRGFASLRLDRCPRRRLRALTPRASTADSSNSQHLNPRRVLDSNSSNSNNNSSSRDMASASRILMRLPKGRASPTISDLHSRPYRRLNR